MVSGMCDGDVKERGEIMHADVHMNFLFSDAQPHAVQSCTKNPCAYLCCMAGTSQPRTGTCTDLHFPLLPDIGHASK